MLYDWPSFRKFFKIDFNRLKRPIKTLTKKRKLLNNEGIPRWVSQTCEYSKKYIYDRRRIKRAGARFTKINNFRVKQLIIKYR